MNQTLIELALRRGQLIERIAGQRAALARELQPVQTVLHVTDRTLGGVRAGASYLKRHPSVLLTAGIVLAMLRPRHLWPWLRRSLIAWRAWRAMQVPLASLNALFNTFAGRFKR